MSATWSTSPWGKPGAEAATSTVLGPMARATAEAERRKSEPTGRRTRRIRKYSAGMEEHGETMCLKGKGETG